MWVVWFYIFMSTTPKLVFNIVFNSATKVVSTLLALFALSEITQYLGADGFGRYATALAYFALFGALADLGLFSITAREISRKNADESLILGNVFTLRLLSSLGVVVLAPPIVWFLTPYPDDTKMAIMLTLLAFFLSSSYMVLNGVFQKHLAMYKVALVELFGKVIQVGFILWMIAEDKGFLAIVLSLVVFMGFNFVLVYTLSRAYVKFRLRFDVEFIRSFLKQSLPLGGAVVVTYVYFKLDTILLSFLKSDEAVGIYNGAYKIIENVTFFPAMIIGMVLPLMSRYIFEEREKFLAITNKTLKVFFVLIVPIVVGGFLLSRDIIQIITQEEFESFRDSVGVLQILIFALGLIFLGHLFNAILIVSNHQKRLMQALMVCAVTNIALNIFFIVQFSYYGAAITSVMTELLVVIVTWYLSYRYTGYAPKLDGIVQILLSGVLMGLFIVYFHSTLPFLVLFILSGVVYFLALFFTKAISREELVLLFFSKKPSVKK